MDFDPGFFSEDDLDDLIDSMEEIEESEPEDVPEPEVEYDASGNVIAAVAGTGFGYHMAQDEIEERQIAEKILADREGKKGEPVKVPLSHRRDKKKGHMTPFARWATRVNMDPSKRDEDIEYTKEEQLQILRAEGD